MYPVKIWSLVTIAFYCGISIPGLRDSIFAASFFITVLGLVGEIWDDILTDYSLQPSAYGLSMLLLIFMWICKKAFLPPMKSEENRWDVSNAIHPFIHPYAIFKGFIPYLLGLNGITAATHLALTHWFTTMTHWEFIGYFTLTSWTLTVLPITAFVVLVYWLEKYKVKQSALHKDITWFHCVFICVQPILLYFAILIAYWPLYYDSGITQALSMVIGLTVFPIGNLVLYVSGYFIDTVFVKKEGKEQIITKGLLQATAENEEEEELEVQVFP